MTPYTRFYGKLIWKEVLAYDLLVAEVQCVNRREGMDALAKVYNIEE